MTLVLEAQAPTVITPFMRDLFTANPFISGLIVFGGSVVIFVGTIWLLLGTNVGKKLGFLLTGAGVSGWVAINSILFILYAPRGPRQDEIDGLNAFELRLVPLSWLLISGILFFMFVSALSKYEAEQNKTMSG